MTPQIKLYHGTNVNHEFWQSEDGEILILRVHGENAWSSHRNAGFVACHDSVEEAASGHGAALDTSRAYREINGKFHLLFNLHTAA